MPHTLVLGGRTNEDDSGGLHTVLGRDCMQGYAVNDRVLLSVSYRNERMARGRGMFVFVQMLPIHFGVWGEAGPWKCFLNCDGCAQVSY